MEMIQGRAQISTSMYIRGSYVDTLGERVRDFYETRMFFRVHVDLRSPLSCVEERRAVDHYRHRVLIQCEVYVRSSFLSHSFIACCSRLRGVDEQGERELFSVDCALLPALLPRDSTQTEFPFFLPLPLFSSLSFVLSCFSHVERTRV